MHTRTFAHYTAHERYKSIKNTKVNNQTINLKQDTLKVKQQQPNNVKRVITENALQT